jgi:hypothetical protein
MMCQIYKVTCHKSALKMETVCFSETLATTDESTRRQNPEEHHHPHRRENLKSHMLQTSLQGKQVVLVCNIDLAIRRQFFKVEVRTESETRSCAICDAQGGSGAGFQTAGLLFFSYQLSFQKCSTSIYHYHQGW